VGDAETGHSEAPTTGTVAKKAAKGNNFSYIDHQLIKEFDDDLIFSMLSSLTHRLDLSLKEFDQSRASTLQMSNELQEIVSQHVDEDTTYQAGQERSRKAAR
jgi:hypothetical protein